MYVCAYSVMSRRKNTGAFPLPSPTSGALPNTGIKPVSVIPPALAGRFFIAGPPGKPTV